MVVWLIGLSGSGKTTLAEKIFSEVKEGKQNVILIDGDVIREIFGNDLGYSSEDRFINAQRISRLCKLLDSQGIHVVCAILSLFPKSRKWNRENIENYYEVFIDTPIDLLLKRDSKGIYKRYLNGEIDNVAGMDLDFKAPMHSNLIINNSHTKDYLLSFSPKITNIILSSSD